MVVQITNVTDEPQTCRLVKNAPLGMMDIKKQKKEVVKEPIALEEEILINGDETILCIPIISREKTNRSIKLDPNLLKEIYARMETLKSETI